MATRFGTVAAKGGNAPAFGAVSRAVKKKPAAGGTCLNPAEVRSKGERQGTMKNETKKICTVSVRWMQALISETQAKGRGVCSIESNEPSPRANVRLTARHAAEESINCLADRPYLPHGRPGGNGQAGGLPPGAHQLDPRQQ